MREQQNPSTPELHQPLLFAPSELLARPAGRASPSTRRRPHGGRRAVLAHVACDGVGASPGRVGTHGHQLLLDRSRLRFEGEVKNSRVRSRRATAICRGPPAKALAFRRGAGDVGTLVAYDLVSGATQYQADRLMGRSKGYRVLGLREGITVVGYLDEAYQLMRADWRRRDHQGHRPLALARA